MTSLLFVVTLPSLAVAAPDQWVKYSGNPVLGPSPGGWDADYTVNPRVVYDQTGFFRMWYNGGSTGSNGIGYATSVNGFSWTKHAGRVLTPGPSDAWDSATVQLGSVLWNGTNFLMWYRGSNGVTNDAGAVGLAMSKDGVSWTKFDANPIMKPSIIDQGFVGSPYVIRENITYNMWYTGRNSTKANAPNKILYATSYDGTHWSKWPSAVFPPSTDPKAWDSSAVYSPSAYFNGTILGLWYSGIGQSITTPQIGFATSPDGATWTRYPTNPILSPGIQGAWDSAGVEQPGVVYGPNGFYGVYYDGFSVNAGGRIGLARAPEGFPIPEFPIQENPSLILVLAIAVCSIVYFNRLHKKLD